VEVLPQIHGQFPCEPVSEKISKIGLLPKLWPKWRFVFLRHRVQCLLSRFLTRLLCLHVRCKSARVDQY